MFRRGKDEGWLELPEDAFVTWAKMNDVAFDNTVPGTISGRGRALLARTELNELSDDAPTVLLTVPKDMILSLERVQEHVKADQYFREFLDSLGDFGRSPRGAILSFLLEQAFISCPDRPHVVGVHTPFIDYIKSLPLPSLPTFWSEEELQLLVGTTLAPAMVAKLKSLRREYDLICESSSRWYNIVEDKITFDDWLFVDAMYRSRALEMPGIGHCMVPCIDLANHASGDETIARYEKDHDGNAVLLLQEDKNVRQDEEITITYGDEKGACEMLFSYGFIEDKMDSAEALFLSLTIPEDDKYRIAKTKFAECAPGFKVIDDGDGGFDFDGDYVWLLCVNEEDGLRFEISRTVDGEEEEAAFFQGTELTGGATQLRSLLEESELYDLYILRAITIFQSRVFDQLQLIAKSRDVVERINDHFREVRGHSDENDTRDRPYNLSITLRRLEQDLQDKAHHFLEAQKLALMESPVVVRYLASINSEGHGNEAPVMEDFS